VKIAELDNHILMTICWESFGLIRSNLMEMSNVC